MWGDKHQVIVTTHLDKDHIHNHFCVNSVSFLDGEKYNYSKDERARMIATSDYYCQQNGLSIIKASGAKTPPRNIYMAEKSGETTQYTLMHAAISEALKNACTFKQLEIYLKHYGYEVDFNSRYPGIKLPNKPYFTRFTTIDKSFTIDFIKESMSHNAGVQKKYKAPQPPAIPFQVKREWQYKKATGLKALYLYYCYQLGILPKETKYKPVHPALLEDIKKLDDFSKQTIIIAKNNLETVEDLNAYMKNLQSEIDSLLTDKSKLQNQIRRPNGKDIIALREQKTELTAQITERRKELKQCDTIKTRSEERHKIAEIVTKQQDKVKSREY